MLANRNCLHADKRGGVIAASDGSGEGTIQGYWPCGEPGAANGCSGSRFRGTGQILLFEAEPYHYYKARGFIPPGKSVQTDSNQRNRYERRLLAKPRRSDRR
jgi:hypothetical protein